MKRSFVFFFLCMTVLCHAFAQDHPAWSSVREVFPKVWVIGDHGADNIYLIEGKDSPLQVDTRLGAAVLASRVKGIMNGSLERKSYQSFAGNAMITTFGKASVAFNPDNL
jgi:hypothetical protein